MSRFIPYPLWVVLRIAVLSYAGLFVLLALGQRRFIYYPTRGDADRLTAQAARAALEPWRSADGELIGWLGRDKHKENARTNVLLVFHGNAGQAINRLYLANGFQSARRDDQAWDVYLFEYPGFGARPGTPGEEAILQAADEAFRELAGDERPIYLLGESLGGGVACHLAGKYPERVAGVVLLTPFTSLPDVAAYHYPVFPVRLLLRDRYDNAEALQSYRGPLAVLLAQYDKVVPARFGQTLFDGYHGPKRLWQQPVDHNSLNYSPGNPWWKELIDFLTLSERSDT